MSKDIYEIARQRYLSSNTTLQNELADLSNEAKALGVDLEEYKNLKLKQNFEEHAKSLGIDSFELTLRIAIDSEEEKQKLRIDQAKQLADSLGIDWEDYITLNPQWK